MMMMMMMMMMITKWKHHSGSICGITSNYNELLAFFVILVLHVIINLLTLICSHNIFCILYLFVFIIRLQNKTTGVSSSPCAVLYFSKQVLGYFLNLNLNGYVNKYKKTQKRDKYVTNHKNVFHHRPVCLHFHNPIHTEENPHPSPEQLNFPSVTSPVEPDTSVNVYMRLLTDSVPHSC